MAHGRSENTTTNKTPPSPPGLNRHLIAGSWHGHGPVVSGGWNGWKRHGSHSPKIIQIYQKSQGRIGVKLLIKNQDVSLLSCWGCWGSLSSMIEWMGQNLSQHMKGRWTSRTNCCFDLQISSAGCYSVFAHSLMANMIKSQFARQFASKAGLVVPFGVPPF